MKNAESERQHLNLRPITKAHMIPEINELVHRPGRLKALTELAGTTLEPYPVAVIASTITFMGAAADDGVVNWHTDVETRALRSTLLTALHHDSHYAVLDLFHVNTIDDTGFDAFRRAADRACRAGRSRASGAGPADRGGRPPASWWRARFLASPSRYASCTAVATARPDQDAGTEAGGTVVAPASIREQWGYEG